MIGRLSRRRCLCSPTGAPAAPLPAIDAFSARPQTYDPPLLLAMKTSPSAARISRRRFIAATAAAVAAPTIIPASALGKDDQPAPSERIVVGIVGWGMMGPGNTTG